MVNSGAVERYLFLAGCPRSGTSALVFLLNEHPQLALGFERFKRVRAQLDPFHFTKSQFLAPVAAETDIRGELLYGRLRERWESGTVKVVGDKVPLYTRVLPQLLARFPGGRVVVLVRDPLDVALSFVRRARDPEDWWPAENDHTLAVRMWNEALAAVRAAELDGEGARIMLLPYEPLFEGEGRWLEALLAFAGLPPSARVEGALERLVAGWRTRAGAPEPDRALKAYVEEHAEQELWSWARERIDRQLGELDRMQAGVPVASIPGEHEEPLTARELDERRREQEQLLAEMRRPGERAGDEVEILERRLVEQAGELAGRGERLRAGMSAAGPAAGSRPRVTFILPHQRSTTGGVYVIEQFARHLARDMDVCLAVRGASTRAVPGVEVRPVEELRAEFLPRADVLVYPADLRDADLVFDLPPHVGRPVMLFQGYGTPGSPVVEANLARAEAVVAIAHWLVDLALSRETPCAHVPEGLDHEVFAPGPPQTERAAQVTVMTHRLDWKGLEDALAAVALVRAARADVEVTLFGTEPVEGVGRFLASPTRPQVAELLRCSAVHVVSSWEEGFGLTGAEAIACGAALATTDTKGSRDYAVDGHTALVSAPRDPEALAANVLTLLDDAELRARLVRLGQRHLRTVMPPWPEAARRMGFALFDA